MAYGRWPLDVQQVRSKSGADLATLQRSSDETRRLDDLM
jgi:hypothetical protein